MKDSSKQSLVATLQLFVGMPLILITMGFTIVIAGSTIGKFWRVVFDIQHDLSRLLYGNGSLLFLPSYRWSDPVISIGTTFVILFFFMLLGSRNTSITYFPPSAAQMEFMDRKYSDSQMANFKEFETKLLALTKS